MRSVNSLNERRAVGEQTTVRDETRENDVDRRGWSDRGVS